MLNSDFAKLYQVETKRINEAVKNSPLKFPERYSFILIDKESIFLVEIFDQKKETRGGKYKNPRVFTEEECSRFQFETLNSKGNMRGQHLKYNPYVFTEQGVALIGDH